MKNLPIGIQTFHDIRDKKENYIYIDKTDLSRSNSSSVGTHTRVYSLIAFLILIYKLLLTIL